MDIDFGTLSERNDVAVVCIQRVAGEFFDREDYCLRSEEVELITAVCDQFHSRGKMWVAPFSSQKRLNVDAILVVWHCGVASGEMIADALLGKHTPSGKLPMTFLKSLADTSARSFPGKELAESVFAR
jgi:beta-glucosidase